MRTTIKFFNYLHDISLINQPFLLCHSWCRHSKRTNLCYTSKWLTIANVVKLRSGHGGRSSKPFHVLRKLEEVNKKGAFLLLPPPQTLPYACIFALLSSVCSFWFRPIMCLVVCCIRYPSAINHGVPLVGYHGKFLDNDFAWSKTITLEQNIGLFV